MPLSEFQRRAHMREPVIHRAGEPSRAREDAKGRSGGAETRPGHGEAGWADEEVQRTQVEGSREHGELVPLESVVCHLSQHMDALHLNPSFGVLLVASLYRHDLIKSLVIGDWFSSSPSLLLQVKGGTECYNL